MADDIFEAITEGAADHLRLLIETQPNIVGTRNSAGLSPIIFAAYHRKLEHLDLLLAANPTLDAFEAAAVGETDRLERLLEDNPSSARSVSSDGVTALHLACFFGRAKAAGLLLDAGADANAVASDGFNRVRPLHSAAAGGSLEIVALLLGHDADVDAQQAGGWTALHAVAMQGRQDMARLLLAHGSDPEIRNDDGKQATDLTDDAQMQRTLHAALGD